MGMNCLSWTTLLCELSQPIVFFTGLKGMCFKNIFRRERENVRKGSSVNFFVFYPALSAERKQTAHVLCGQSKTILNILPGDLRDRLSSKPHKPAAEYSFVLKRLTRLLNDHCDTVRNNPHRLPRSRSAYRMRFTASWYAAFLSRHCVSLQRA